MQPLTPGTPHPASAPTSCLRSRTPQFVGTCSNFTSCNMTTMADASGAPQVVYSCPSTTLSPDACGDACDTQAICAALCVCDPGCATATQVCTCSACTQVESALQDPAFLAMEAMAGGTVSTQAFSFAADSSSSSDDASEGGQGGGDGSGASPDGSSAPGPRRRLQQSSDSSALADVLAAVSALQDSQAALAQDVQGLQAQVVAANTAAQDSTGSAQSMIQTGQAAISAKQAALQSALTTIIGQQNAAAAAQAATVQALANLQTLQAQQLQAQQAAAQAAAGQVRPLCHRFVFCVCVATPMPLLCSLALCVFGVVCTRSAGEFHRAGAAAGRDHAEPGAGALPAGPEAEPGRQQGGPARQHALHHQHRRAGGRGGGAGASGHAGVTGVRCRV